ncbi:hypothetical protein D3C75_704960 [compost metagenome]
MQFVAADNQERLWIFLVEVDDVLELADVPTKLRTFALDAVTAIENDFVGQLAEGLDLFSILWTAVFENVMAQASHCLFVIATTT